MNSTSTYSMPRAGLGMGKAAWRFC
jgi:hypothetical protein